MAYGDFTLELIEENFGIKNRVGQLFPSVQPVAPSEWLRTTLAQNSGLRLSSEKAKSEAIVFPILMELRQRNDHFLTIHSGCTLSVAPEKGFNGDGWPLPCDFILAKDVQSFGINYPIIQIVEAKRGEIELGVAQCAAQLIGARLFNQKRNVELPAVYGCVTNGNEWLFLKLADELTIDPKLYFLEHPDEVLGVFQQIINFYKSILA